MIKPAKQAEMEAAAIKAAKLAKKKGKSKEETFAAVRGAVFEVAPRNALLSEVFAAADVGFKSIGYEYK